MNLFSNKEKELFGVGRVVWDRPPIVSYAGGYDRDDWDVKQVGIRDDPDKKSGALSYLGTFREVYTINDYLESIERMKREAKDSGKIIKIVDLMTSWATALEEIQRDLQPFLLKGLIVSLKSELTDEQEAKGISALGMSGYSLNAREKGDLGKKETWLRIYDWAGGVNSLDQIWARGWSGAFNLPKDFDLGRVMIFACFRLLKPGGEAMLEIPAGDHFFGDTADLRPYENNQRKWQDAFSNSGLGLARFGSLESRDVLYLKKYKDADNIPQCEAIFGPISSHL